MSLVLKLRGRNALPPFRIQKLQASLSGTRIARVHAQFWHFVKLHQAPSGEEHAVLERVLAYGPATGDDPPAGAAFLVVPRPGTISPWASKATDIAHNCGLQQVERMERGVMYTVATDDGAPLTEADRARLLPAIHDRMTEAVVASLDQAELLFRDYPPRPWPPWTWWAADAPRWTRPTSRWASRSPTTRSNTWRRIF
jgi:phosphoribosylformylglycinamidine synthase